MLGLAGGAGDRLERLGGRLRVVRRQALAGGRLDHHHADRVRHDVVQLRRDPGPLVAHRQRGVGLALRLELPGPGRQLVGHHGALAQPPPRPPAGDGDEQVRRRRVAEDRRSGHRGPGQDHHAGDSPPLPVEAPGHEPVRGDQQDDREGVAARHHVERRGREHQRRREGPGDGRRHPAEPEQQAQRDGGRDLGGGRPAPDERGGGAHGAAAQRDPPIGPPEAHRLDGGQDGEGDDGLGAAAVQRRLQAAVLEGGPLAGPLDGGGAAAAHRPGHP